MTVARKNMSEPCFTERSGYRHSAFYFSPPIFLPRYSPYLKIVETWWRKLKYKWLTPLDYQSKEPLFYQINLALKAVGNGLFIGCSKFRLTWHNICRTIYNEVLFKIRSLSKTRVLNLTCTLIELIAIIMSENFT